MTPPPRRSPARRPAPGRRTFYPLATAVLVIAALYWAKPVLIPLALAVLLAFALSPPTEWLERRGFGRVPAALAVSALALALLTGLAWVAVAQARRLSAELPRHGPE